MKQTLSILGSMKTTAILMIIFATAIGYATFIENDYGTITAKAEVYSARWFEILLVFLTINLIINIYRYKMFTLKKAPIFIFHIAFIIIIIGAAITRYVGYEGTMRIREGHSASTMLSAETLFMVNAKFGDKNASTKQSLYLSKKSKNSLSSSLNIEDKNIKVDMIEYIPDVMESVVDAKDGSGYEIAEIMITGSAGGEPVLLKRGSFFESSDFVLDFDSKKSFNKPVISLFSKDGNAFIKHDMNIFVQDMQTNTKSKLPANDKEPLLVSNFYTVGSSNFVLKKFYTNSKTKMITNPNASAMRPGYDGLRFKVSVNDKSKELLIFGKSGTLAKEYHTQVDGVDISLSYGSKILNIPFEIKLVKFELDRYPGSMSPASYASEVILIDKEQNIKIPYRIFMNNILEHRGYRFFQASYDKDEKGTILSVNNDPGTLPSYIGYFLLSLGMLWSLFSRHNRFAQLAKRAKKACDLKASDAKTMAVLLMAGMMISSIPVDAQELTPSLKTAISFDKAHAKKFGELVIQDSGGRMKPMNTLTTEILAKLYNKTVVKIGKNKLNSDQIILGMMIKPDAYRDLKIIKTKDKEVNKILGLPPKTKYASFAEFFTTPDNLSGYKLAKAVDTAVRKEPKYRNLFDKAVLKVDERVNIAYSVYSGELIKMWPKPNDINNKWYPTIRALKTFNKEHSDKIRTIIIEYFTAINNSLSTNDWSKANEAVDKIAEFQKFYGAEVYPSKNRILAEVFYNKANIFERLYLPYLLVGFVLLILSFVKILKPKFNISIYSKATLVLLIVFFTAQSFGLGLRWYISGHAPWSDGYESMIYIAWATVLAGFLFSKRSSMTMASTSVLAGLILWVAHLNWMNPQVTNLVPVLNSYWLSIHVSSITASYGFLALSALLGFVSIVLFNIRNTKNEKHINLSIKELNSINEMSLMIGLALLTIGNFLGGVWANESWGRYWGWDPKETWALVTILVYAVVVHLRFIKSIYSEFNFAVISLLSFTSVLMTYFGVNYYLAGLHSYAKGDPVPVPDFVPVTYFILFLFIALAFRNRKIA